MLGLTIVKLLNSNTVKRNFTLLSIFCLLLTFGATAQNITNSFSYGGRTRDYIVHLPAGYVQGTPAPLVLMLHGLGDEMANFMNGTGFNGQSETHNFIAVYPNAVNEFGAGRAWNNTTIPFSTVDDVGFINTLLDTLEATYSVNTDRIYSAGFSMGGIMSQYLACELGDRITAIASVGGPAPSAATANCQANRPVPVMHIHGDADGTVPYTGGLPGLNAVDPSLQFWVNHNGCPASANVTNSRPDGITVEQYLWGLCTDSSEVLHFKLLGGDHIWPGSANDINANVEIWKFFDRHHLNAGPTGIEPLSELPISIWPVPSSGDFTVEYGKWTVAQLRVLDMMGKEIWKYEVPMDELETKIPAFNWESGVYLLELQSPEGQVAYRRLVHD